MLARAFVCLSVSGLTTLFLIKGVEASILKHPRLLYTQNQMLEHEVAEDRLECLKTAIEEKAEAEADERLSDTKESSSRSKRPRSMSFPQYCPTR